MIVTGQVVNPPTSVTHHKEYAVFSRALMDSHADSCAFVGVG